MEVKDYQALAEAVRGRIEAECAATVDYFPTQMEYVLRDYARGLLSRYEAAEAACAHKPERYYCESCAFEGEEGDCRAAEFRCEFQGKQEIEIWLVCPNCSEGLDSDEIRSTAVCTVNADTEPTDFQIGRLDALRTELAELAALLEVGI